MNAKVNKGRATAYKRRGIWVFRTGGRLKASVVRATIEEVREERAQEVLGVGHESEIPQSQVRKEIPKRNEEK
jgi:hypothetical protein